MSVLQRCKLGVQGSESSYLTVWVILYISPHDYVISLDLKLSLSNQFGYQKFGKGIPWT